MPARSTALCLLNGRILRGRSGSLGDGRIPVVAVSMPFEIDVPSVMIDEQGASAMAVEHLLDLGHRSFGYIAGPEGHAVELLRWQGFVEALARAGIDTSRQSCA